VVAASGVGDDFRFAPVIDGHAAHDVVVAHTPPMSTGAAIDHSCAPLLGKDDSARVDRAVT
jgi:hypothetical protein